MQKIIALLILVSLPANIYTEVTLDGTFPTYRVLKGNEIQMNLNEVFDLSDLDYKTATFEVTSGGGQVYSFNNPAYKLEVEDIGELKFVEIINKETFALAEKKTDSVTLFQCKVQRRDKGLSCEVDKINPQKPTADTYITDSIAFDSANKMVFIAWRSPDEKILLIGSYKEDGTLIKQVQFDIADTPLSNRVRLEVVETPYYDPTKAPRIQLFAFDQFTNNGVDETVSLSLISFDIIGGIIQDGEIYRYQGSEELVDPLAISTFYEFENQLYVSAPRIDKSNHLCLTRLTLSSIQKIASLEDDAFYCSDITTGFLGFGHGGEIFEFIPADKMVSAKSVIWSPLVKTPTVNDIGEFIIKDGLWDGKSGIREIRKGFGNYLLRFAKDKGIDDSGKNSIVVADGYLQMQFNANEGNVNALVNVFNLEFTQKFLNLYVLQGAYYVLNTIQPDTARVDISILVKDAETPDGVTASGSWYVVKDPFDTVEFASYVHPPLEIYPGGYSRFNFPYSTIATGNDLRFEVNFNSDPYLENFETQSKLYQDHEVAMSVNLNRDDIDIQEFHVMSGAAVFQNATQIYWFVCTEENEFATQCFDLESVPTYGMNLQTRMDGALQVIYSWTYKDASPDNSAAFSYFNWYEFGLDGGRGSWQYEYYDGRIVDVGHTRTIDGNVYTVIAFTDRVMISLFFDDWSYGNRKNVVFTKDDINDRDFCPKQVSFNPKQRSVIYVFSDCEDEQQIVVFTVDEIGSVAYEYSHFLGNDFKDPEICVLEDEIVIYEQEKRTITSLDEVFSFTMIQNDYSLLKINNIADFACFPQQNEFYILSNIIDKEKQHSEVVVFNGAAQKDIYNRIKMRLTNLQGTFQRLQPFYHRGEVVLALYNDKGIPTYKRFNSQSPAISIKSSFFQSQAKEIPYSMIVRSNGKGSRLVPGILRVLPTMNMTAPVLRDQKQKIEVNRAYPLNYYLDLSKTPIVDLEVDSDDTNIDPEKYFKVMMGAKSKTSFFQGKNPVGKFVELEQSPETKYYMIAGYSRSSRLKYGTISMYTKDGGVPKQLSSFYGYNAFKSVSAIQQKAITLFAMVTNEGEYTGVQVTIAIKGILSTKSVDINGISEISSVDIFMRDSKLKAELNQETGSYVVFLLAYSEKNRRFTGYNVAIDIGNPTADGVQGVDDWQATLIGNGFSSDFDYKVGSFSVVDQVHDGNVMNIYMKNLKDAATYLMIVDKKDSMFFTPKKLSLEPTQGKTDSEVADISCSRFKEVSSFPDTCAFSTYGAVVYFAQITAPTGDPVVKSMRLRKSGDFYGTRVSVVDRFVMLETERVTPTQDKMMMFWDVTNYTKPNSFSQQVEAQDIPTFTLMDMRIDERDNYFDSKFLAATIETEEFLNYRALVFVQNEYADQSIDDYNVFVDQIQVTPWLMSSVKMPESEDVFNKLKLNFYDAEQRTVSVMMSDFLEFKSQVQED